MAIDGHARPCKSTHIQDGNGPSSGKTFSTVQIFPNIVNHSCLRVCIDYSRSFLPGFLPPANRCVFSSKTSATQDQGSVTAPSINNTPLLPRCKNATGSR